MWPSSAPADASWARAARAAAPLPLFPHPPLLPSPINVPAMLPSPINVPAALAPTARAVSADTVGTDRSEITSSTAQETTLPTLLSALSPTLPYPGTVFFRPAALLPVDAAAPPATGQQQEQQEEEEDEEADCSADAGTSGTNALLNRAYTSISFSADTSATASSVRPPAVPKAALSCVTSPHGAAAGATQAWASPSPITAPSEPSVPSHSSSTSFGTHNSPSLSSWPLPHSTPGLSFTHPPHHSPWPLPHQQRRRSPTAGRGCPTPSQALQAWPPPAPLTAP